MKAAVIHEHGGIEQVVIEEIADPKPKRDEVLIAVRAAALNHLDIWVRKGGRADQGISYPHVLGSDACGVVVEIGEDVENVSVGEEIIVDPGLSPSEGEYTRRGEGNVDPDFGVVGFTSPGTFAEKVAVPARNVYPKPSHLSDEEGAALPLAYVTAWRMLMTRAELVPGETVLIHGIGGGVAIAGLQLGKIAGAELIVTSSCEDKLERARQLGADHTINYKTTPDVAGAVREITGGRGVDIAFDTVGAATWPINFEAVRKGGRIVHCGITTGKTVEANIQALYWNQLTVMGSTMGSAEDFRQLMSAVRVNGLKPVIDSVYSLDEAREAMARMEAGEQFGKIVLNVEG